MTFQYSVRYKAIKDRAQHYVSPEVAQSAGLTFEQLRLFVSGSWTPPRPVLDKLAARMGIEP